ncbi:hypothetical protein A4D02_31415 [Niastella koreensis]|uniref:Uncharacterized protein n=1 Tax=Niastella koreensis TaxID=354356 RepID=A0ABX3NXY2_9BACT|nr:hypothetical protein A4D02_31415 [Niastella koreensis]
MDRVSNTKRLPYVCYVNYEKYENVITSPDKLEFQFVSEGPGGPSTLNTIYFFVAQLVKGQDFTG